MAGIYNFEIKEGETFYRKVYWQSSNEIPFDFNDSTPLMEVRKYDCNGELFKDMSADIVVSSSFLEINLSWQDSLMFNSDLLMIPLVYDLFLEKNGNRYCLLQGEISINCRRTKK